MSSNIRQAHCSAKVHERLRELQVGIYNQQMALILFNSILLNLEQTSLLLCNFTLFCQKSHPNNTSRLTQVLSLFISFSIYCQASSEDHQKIFCKPVLLLKLQKNVICQFRLETQQLLYNHREGPFLW